MFWSSRDGDGYLSRKEGELALIEEVYRCEPSTLARPSARARLEETLGCDFTYHLLASLAAGEGPICHPR
jgi:hypothetical protein